MNALYRKTSLLWTTKLCSEKGLRNFPELRHRAESTAGISERAIRWKWKIAKCSGELGRRRLRGGGSPGIRVHWPICSATTPAPGSDALSKYILVVPRTRRTLRHTPIFSRCICAGRRRVSLYIKSLHERGDFQSWRRLKCWYTQNKHVRIVYTSEAVCRLSSQRVLHDEGRILTE